MKTATPTLGTLMHMDDLRKQADGQKGLALIKAKLRELNFRYCWTPGLQAKWPIVNRLLWRFELMFEGTGDLFLAGFAGALPNQKFWPCKTYNADGLVTLPGYRQPAADQWVGDPESKSEAI